MYSRTDHALAFNCKSKCRMFLKGSANTGLNERFSGSNHKLIIEGLAIQILAPTIHMLKCPWARV